MTITQLFTSMSALPIFQMGYSFAPPSVIGEQGGA